MVIHAAFTQATTSFGYLFQYLIAVAGQFGKIVAGFEYLRVFSTEKVDDKQGNVLELDCRIADRATGSQPVSCLLVFQLRPQHARGINQFDILRHRYLLGGLGHCRFITDPGNFTSQQFVHQGGFADIGNPDDHDPGNFVLCLLHKRRQLPEKFAHVRFCCLVQCQSGNVLAAVIVQPALCQHGVGEVCLVKNFQPRDSPDQSIQKWILTGLWQSGIDNFNDDIDAFQAIHDILASLVHMARIPADCHEHLQNWGKIGVL